MHGNWAILDQSGAPALNFTSLIQLDATCGGKVLSKPVELGAFVNYNKSREPLRVKLDLGFQGDGADLERALDKLERYKAEAVLLTLVSPGALYRDLTLEKYSYGRGLHSGSGLLTVSLDLVEVRQADDLDLGTGPGGAQLVSTGTVNPVDRDSSDPKYAAVFKKLYAR